MCEITATLAITVSFKDNGNASKTRIVFIFFYALLILKALTEEYTYNLAHTVQSNKKKEKKRITFKRSAGWQVSTSTV